MADVGKHHFIKSEHSHRVLVPQPSQDPHDPLNWKPMWKLSTIITVSTMTFTQGFAPLALAPMIPYLMADYKSSLGDIIQFTGITILILGFSNFIWLVLLVDHPPRFRFHTCSSATGLRYLPRLADAQCSLRLSWHVWHLISSARELPRTASSWVLVCE